MTGTGSRSLATLPKAHLHVHLEGAMRPSTLDEFCKRRGTVAPPVATSYGTFADFQALYVAARTSIETVDDLDRLVSEVVEDAAADGAVWIEPAFHLPGHPGLGDDVFVLEVLLEAGRRATAATGVGIGWLVSIDRTQSPALAVEQATIAARYAGNGVVALGLANDEAAGAPEPFAPAFAIAREAGLISAPHAGEHGGPDSVRGALDALGAQRIQHGVRSLEDPDVVQRLVDADVCLDVCPTSNVSLSVVEALSTHPLPALLDAGVFCSINADDPLLFSVGLLDEYIVGREQLGLDDTSLADCARTSIERSGAPAEMKALGARNIDSWLL
ncbi:MAG TPA: adenosine deaminase [Acidimicrobiales bacterium]|nr:adenosine deaminase [Acidimicrobiales bacterium]